MQIPPFMVSHNSPIWIPFFFLQINCNWKIISVTHFQVKDLSSFFFNLFIFYIVWFLWSVAFISGVFLSFFVFFFFLLLFLHRCQWVFLTVWKLVSLSLSLSLSFFLFTHYFSFSFCSVCLLGKLRKENYNRENRIFLLQLSLNVLIN